MLFENLHRDAVPQIVWLQFWAADLGAVHLVESPNVLAGHGCPWFADRAPPPRRPEERRLRPELVKLLGEHAFHVSLQKLHHHGGERYVSQRATLHADAAQAPGAVEVMDA